jgi:hypothetical protein
VVEEHVLREQDALVLEISNVYPECLEILVSEPATYQKINTEDRRKPESFTEAKSRPPHSSKAVAKTMKRCEK